MKFSHRLIERLRKATTVVTLTGAGISAASGVPTFRGKDGLWNKFNPRELANVEAFLRNPDLVWEWYSWRRNLIRNVQPNPGHYALVELEKLLPDFWVVTQNVDNLHQTAGTQKIIELHGNILRNRCIDCNEYVTDEYLMEYERKAGKTVPRCPHCRGLIRPDVVWFGEFLPPEAIEKAQQLAYRAEVYFSVGTSATVEPAASLPLMARNNGAYVVEINPEETPLTDAADESVRAGADEALPELVEMLKQARSSSQ